MYYGLSFFPRPDLELMSSVAGRCAFLSSAIAEDRRRFRSMLPVLSLPRFGWAPKRFPDAGANQSLSNGRFTRLPKSNLVSSARPACGSLLWDDDFSDIRDFLIGRADLMISDCSGVSPLHALPAGFVYTTFGRYEGLLSLAKDQAHEQALILPF